MIFQLDGRRATRIVAEPKGVIKAKFSPSLSMRISHHAAIYSDLPGFTGERAMSRSGTTNISPNAQKWKSMQPVRMPKSSTRAKLSEFPKSQVNGITTSGSTCDIARSPARRLLHLRNGTISSPRNNAASSGAIPPMAPQATDVTPESHGYRALMACNGMALHLSFDFCSGKCSLRKEFDRAFCDQLATPRMQKSFSMEAQHKPSNIGDPANRSPAPKPAQDRNTTAKFNDVLTRAMGAQFENQTFHSLGPIEQFLVRFLHTILVLVADWVRPLLALAPWLEIHRRRILGKESSYDSQTEDLESARAARSWSSFRPWPSLYLYNLVSSSASTIVVFMGPHILNKYLECAKTAKSGLLFCLNHLRIHTFLHLTVALNIMRTMAQMLST
ncbi:uncharacterized protein BDR25DRAFT_352310 [Lindgomyces ingoldianus]|uniref:Uncharacterized protein n=1 Tax=Lindgomyces ingoldianus TaxID=673940 RepID=A0ACB6R3J1_9PLEO|nr:uncharacterized protein BDR25DRAFT_352310 [Lindgomyces ingoldianus]KAF2473833.1 hypothetical protein BDR25DRAFT_352310 [Lindgomyces ingoldianus]